MATVTVEAASSPAPAPAPPVDATRGESGSGGTRPRGLLLGVVLGLLLLGGVGSMAAINGALMAGARGGRAGLGHLHDPDGDSFRNGPFDPYPEGLFREDWALRLPPRELAHLTRLHGLCRAHHQSVIPWTAGRENQSATEDLALLINESDPRLFERLRDCPDVEVFVPAGLRGPGYCEDAVAYAKYLHARLLPHWVLTTAITDPATKRTLTYHELCPHTPLIFFNHYWDGVRDDPKWPATKPMYLMPNMEMYELQAEHYRRVDLVLCKTAVCQRNLGAWHAQQGNPNNTRVLYTRHTTTDITIAARETLGPHGLAPKNFVNMTIIHTAGSSMHKGTGRVLDCWLGRPDLPPVDIYITRDLYDGTYKKQYGARIKAAGNVRLHTGYVDAVGFGKIIAEASMFLCTSVMEGYGHYINHARASGGLILTPDVPPMNELVTPASGVLIRANDGAHAEQFLCGQGRHPEAVRNVTGCTAVFSGADVCAAVDEALGLSPAERQRRAERARQQYLYDTLFFAQKMEELRVIARTASSSSTQKHLRDSETRSD